VRDPRRPGPAAGGRPAGRLTGVVDHRSGAPGGGPEGRASRAGRATGPGQWIVTGGWVVPEASGRRAVAALLLAVALLLVSACAPRGAEPVTSDDPSPSATPASGPAPEDAAATAEVTTSASSGARSVSASECALTVGPLLRERTTVTPAGAVTVLAGGLPCAGVGVWVAGFVLDEAAAGDPAPRFAGRYTGAQPLSVRLPAATGRCGAAAVYFAGDADNGGDTGAATAAAQAVRTDLGYWPAGLPATVPGGAILQGRESGVLAATVAGDPSRCSPGESVSTPFAAVGDCWQPGSAASPSAGATARPGGTGFRKTPCTTPHTHEVYWAETLSPQTYRTQTQAQGQATSASAWAHKRAGDVCVARRSSLRLAADVRQTDVFLELLWPSKLEYPPPGAAGWSKAQIVCLVRWKDSRTSPKQLLRH
jgi:hypothetical protein